MNGSADEKIAWMYWLRLANTIAKLGAALCVAFFVAGPIAETVKSCISAEIATFLPDRPADGRPAGMAIPTDSAKTKKAKLQGTSPEKPRDIATNVTLLRVWAYGIQVSGLVAALGVTLWAIVALVRSD
ncbi:MAG: hypothetical protein PHO08_05960 [Methylococcales bacterium]|nr:hypothetical protein [Methylococcales bacterium]